MVMKAIKSFVVWKYGFLENDRKKSSICGARHSGDATLCCRRNS
jgi:hypothetical protein